MTAQGLSRSELITLIFILLFTAAICPWMELKNYQPMPPRTTGLPPIPIVAQSASYPYPFFLKNWDSMQVNWTFTGFEYGAVLVVCGWIAVQFNVFGRK